MADEYISRLTAYLDDHKIDQYFFGHRAKHRELVVTHNGVTYRKVFPATGSDRRGPANAVSDLRHMLGLFDKPSHQTNENRICRKRKPRAKHQRVTAPAAAPVAPATEDRFYAPLLALKARLEAAAASNASDTTQESLTKPAAEATAMKNRTSVSRVKKVRIHTPWLGHRIRYAYIGEFNNGQMAS